MRPLFIAVLAIVGSAACTDDNPGLTIGGNLKADETCGFVAGSANLLPAGTYDIKFPHSYYVAPLFRSGLVARAALPGAPRAEPNDLLIEGAEVTLTTATGALLAVSANPYTVATSAFVPAATDGAPGTAAASVEAIPLSYGTEIAALYPSGGTIVATMQFFGHTTGGTAVDATPWSWTIQVCNGCLEVPCSEMLLDQCFAGQDGYNYQSSSCPVVP